MDIFTLMHQLPWLAFGLALIAGQIVICVLNLPGRILRRLVLLKHGYPPPHCDADGDFREEDEE